MPIISPPIDNRNQQMLAEQIRGLALQYCPEWGDLPAIEADKQADTLILIFSRMMEIVIQRLNKVPDKNFLTFLDLVGVRLSPPRIARAPLTFMMAKGASQYGSIPVGTQVATAETKEQEAVVFETEKALTVIVPKLTKAVSLSPGDDRWIDHSPVIFDKKEEGPEELFRGEDLVPHRICLGHTKLFGFKEKATIVLHVILNNDLNLPADVPWEVNWYYYSEDSPDKVPLRATGYTEDPAVELNPAADADRKVVNLLKSGYITFSEISGIAEKTINGFEKDTGLPINRPCNWIFAELASPIQKTLPEINTLKARALVTPSSSQGAGTISSDGTTITGSGTDFTKLKKGDAITAADQTRIITSINTDISLIINYAFDPKLPAGTTFTYTSPPQPDLAFFNNFPLDLTKDFYLFGEKPKFNDTFYIGSKEVFSKAGAQITVMVALSEGIVPDTTNIKLLWESWDGKSWMKIGETNQGGVKTDGFTDTTYAFKRNGEVTFKCPNIEAKEINGEKNYWIRIRIIGGNYGEEATYEETKPDAGSTNLVWTYKPPTFKPPSVNILALSYSFVPDEKDLEVVLTYNDFVYQDQTKVIQENKSFKPFQLIEDTQPALYLAFDQNIATLPVTIFFPLIGKVISTKKAPIPLIGTGTISSNNTTSNNNTTLIGTGTNFTNELKVGDSIAAIGQARTVTAISSDTSLTVDSAFNPALQAGTRFSYISSHEESQDSLFLIWQYWTGKEWRKLKIEDNTNNLTKRELIQFLAPVDVAKRPCFGFESEYYWIRAMLEKGRYEDFPSLKAIYTNTVWAHNMVTIKDEILGFSNGKPGQVFKFSRSPILSGQKVLVREVSLAEDDRKIIISEEGKDAIEEIPDDAGNIIGFWVRWHEMKNFYFSKPNSRHYIIDLNNGTITFGDGERGMIPLAGKDNIKCSYQSGGGVKGNIQAGTITKLRTSFPYIDSVTNPEAADGGGDKEDLDRLRERGPQTLKHRDRAVTYEDFMWLVREASPKVAKVKCLPTRDPSLQLKPGWVTMIIVPESDGPKPLPTQQLINEIETYLFDRTSSYLTTYPSQINLIGPGYIQVWVEASIQFTSITEAKTIEGRIIDNLQQFFHPLNGGPEKKGWDFGRNVYISEVYELIENTDGVDHVDELTLKAFVQIYKLKLAGSIVPEISYPEHSTVDFNNGQIIFFLAEKLQKDQEIDTLYITGFKEGDQVKISDSNRNYLATLVLKSVSGNTLECETDISTPILKGSIIETPEGIKSYTTKDSEWKLNQSRSILLTVATFSPEDGIIPPGAEIILNHRDDPIYTKRLNIDESTDQIETIFIEDNYLVYSGTHAINKKESA